MREPWRASEARWKAGDLRFESIHDCIPKSEEQQRTDED